MSMTFPGILGHERQQAQLRAALESDRVHHAYLFTGPDGVGKERIARLFAQALVCEESESAHRPCLACDGCRKAEHDSHPDVVLSLPQAEAVSRGLISSADLDKAPSRELRVAEIRELERRIRLPPYEARHKAVIITPADAMNQSAQNALLKTLEEPPPSTTLILVTAAMEALLPTVRSRCARIPFGPLALDLIASELSRRTGCDPAHARVLAALGSGSLGAALSLDLDTIESRAELISSVRRIAPSVGDELVAFAETFSGDRKAADERLEMMALWYRDVLALASGADVSALVNLDRAAEAIEDAERLSSRELVHRLDAISLARRDIAGNVNARLVVEGLMSSFTEGVL